MGQVNTPACGRVFMVRLSCFVVVIAKNLYQLDIQLFPASLPGLLDAKLRFFATWSTSRAMCLPYQTVVGTKFLKLMSSFSVMYYRFASSILHLRLRVPNLLLVHLLPSSRRPLMVEPRCVMSRTACTFKRAVTHPTRTCELSFLVMNCGAIKYNTTLPR